MQYPAKYYEPYKGTKISCVLCPHNCVLKEEEYGKCKARKNETGKLISEVYGMARGLSFDPIEKKPLYHFYPGSNILSLGTPGCNMQCFFCQNWDLSQSGVTQFNEETVNPTQLLAMGMKNPDNIGIAFTYSEPTIFYEYMYDTAVLFKEEGYKTCMISNGYINEKPLFDLMPFMDAFNIDLKAFTNSFYKEYTKSSLNPVLRSLKIISSQSKHLEISFLVIPGLNDNAEDFKEMLKWISNELGRNTVLHINRYFPNYQSSIPPTPVEKLKEFLELSKAKLNYVYLGNYSGKEGQNTYCPKCGSLQIERENYSTKVFLNKVGKCCNCGYEILNKM